MSKVKTYVVDFMYNHSRCSTVSGWVHYPAIWKFGSYRWQRHTFTAKNDNEAWAIIQEKTGCKNIKGRVFIPYCRKGNKRNKSKLNPPYDEAVFKDR